MLGVGVVDAENTQVESPEIIADRIRRALAIVPPDRLLVAPDCGLGYFSRTTAYATPVPVLVGALRRGTSRLAGELADGVVTCLAGPRALRALTPDDERPRSPAR